MNNLDHPSIASDPMDTPVGEPVPDLAVLRALPVAIYMTDAAGTITFFNEAAAELWGHRPVPGRSAFCGSWKLFRPNGMPLPHDQSPMAVALRERRPNRGNEAVAERPDGSRVRFMPYPTPLFDASGTLTGAVAMLVDISDRGAADEAVQQLAAVVESSDDAILTKDLDGIITSWNEGARRLFGYTADQAIGRPVAMLIPLERQDEEPNILGRIRRGERIDHYDTIRRRRDGSLVEISLTVSPLRNARGEIVGASKIARDITERRRAQDQQRLLLREMNHRVKNLFALAGSIVTLSARSARTPQDLAGAATERLAALARAHELTQPDDSGGAERPTTLHALVRAIVSPYDHAAGSRVTVRGADTALSGSTLTSFALLLHEFATNASKYGALSTQDGRVEVDCAEAGDRLVLTWTERGGPLVGGPPGGEGFGTVLARATIKGQFDGEIERDWRPEGLAIRLSVERDRLS